MTLRTDFEKQRKGHPLQLFPAWKFHELDPKDWEWEGCVILYDINKACVCVFSQLCLTLCDSMDCSPQGSSVHGIFWARILNWFSITFFKGLSWHRDRTHVSCVLLHCRQILYLHVTWNKGSPGKEERWPLSPPFKYVIVLQIKLCNTPQGKKEWVNTLEAVSGFFLLKITEQHTRNS